MGEFGVRNTVLCLRRALTGARDCGSPSLHRTPHIFPLSLYVQPPPPRPVPFPSSHLVHTRVPCTPFLTELAARRTTASGHYETSHARMIDTEAGGLTPFFCVCDFPLFIADKERKEKGGKQHPFGADTSARARLRSDQVCDTAGRHCRVFPGAGRPFLIP